MQITRLDHVNICTTQLNSMINWYTDILGLHNGHRPESSSTGAWLYAGDDAVIHLVSIDEPAATGSETKLKLEHFALKATGAAEFESKLLATGEKFKRVELASMDLALYNLWDPDGNHIHIDFTLTDKQ